MAIKINSTEITRKKVKFDLGDEEEVVITLTKTSWAWDLTAPGNIELTIEEIVEICNLIYSEKVLDEGDKIAIYFRKNSPTLIYGPSFVSSCILKTVKIKLFKGQE